MGLLDTLLGKGEVEGKSRSPAFDFLNTASIITRGEPARYNIETQTGSFSTPSGVARAYSPFKNVTVQNNSGQIVRFLPNGNTTNAVVVLNRGMRKLTDIGISAFAVEIVGTTQIGPDTIMVTLWNE